MSIVSEIFKEVDRRTNKIVSGVGYVKAINPVTIGFMDMVLPSSMISIDASLLDHTRVATIRTDGEDTDNGWMKNTLPLLPDIPFKEPHYHKLKDYDDIVLEFKSCLNVGDKVAITIAGDSFIVTARLVDL